jgi:hypothetical protein
MPRTRIKRDPLGCRKIFEQKDSMSDSADEQVKQQQLESWAADRVKQWTRKLQIDDYDFRSWANGASKNRLQAGAIYEYIRESRKLRCLLALMNPKRAREAWEIMRPGSIDGKKPEPGEIESYPAAPKASGAIWPGNVRSKGNAMILAQIQNGHSVRRLAENRKMNVHDCESPPAQGFIAASS